MKKLLKLPFKLTMLPILAILLVFQLVGAILVWHKQLSPGQFLIPSFIMKSKTKGV